MRRSDLNEVLGAFPSWGNASEEQRRAFAHDMEIRQYGIDELRQAWLWFHMGWTAAMSPVTLKNKIRQHVPAFFEGFEPETVEFETVEQLLEISWVHHFTEHPEFYRFSLHRDCRTLMAEYKGGAYWLVVGFIMHPLWHVSPEKLPRWEAKF